MTPLLSACLSYPITPHFPVLECWTCSWKLLMRTESWEAAANIFDVLQFLHSSSFLDWTHGRQVPSRGEAEITDCDYQSLHWYLLLSLLKLMISKEQLEGRCFHLYACLSESSNRTDCISMASSISAFDRTCILSEIVCLMNKYQRGHNHQDTR